LAYSRTDTALNQRSANRLKETNFLSNCARLIGCGSQCEGLGQGQHSVLVRAVRFFLTFFSCLLRSQLLLQIEDPFDSTSHHRQPLLGRTVETGSVIKAVEHVTHDLVLLHHYGNGFSL